jgi:hypothetical protein
MSRYILCTPIAGGFPCRKWPTGSTWADTIGNQLPGDGLLSQINITVPSPVNMRPIDAAGAAVMGLPITTLAAIATNNPCSGGVGWDAGN